MGMYFEIVKSATTNEWHARLRSENERIVFWTQNYASESDARYACKIVRKQAREAKIRPKKGTPCRTSARSPVPAWETPTDLK